MITRDDFEIEAAKIMENLCKEIGVKGVKKMLLKLSYREREIIKLRYGLGDGYSYTLQETAKLFKVTRERIRQIEEKALRRLIKIQQKLDNTKIDNKQL